MAVEPYGGTVIAVAGGLDRLREAAPPGSVAKIVTAYAALAAGVTDSNRRVICRGAFDGRTCATAHGPLTLEQALARSCNVHFMTLGAELGAARLLDVARRFGFGCRTGLDPSESPGTLAGTALDLACGLGPFSATPPQLARALAAVANGGSVLRLHLGDGERAEVVGHLDPRYLGPIRAGLRAAVRAGGTAAGLAGLDVAGKTGTAIFADGLAGQAPRWYGQFAGWAPGDRPEVVVVVRVEGRSAAHDAVPVARTVLERLGQGRAWYGPRGSPIGRDLSPYGGTGERRAWPAGPYAKLAGREEFRIRRPGHPAPGQFESEATSTHAPERHGADGARNARSGARAGRQSEAIKPRAADWSIQVLLWAAADVRSVEISAPGGALEAGPERKGLGSGKVVVRVSGNAVSASLGGRGQQDARPMQAARILLRPAPDGVLAVRPLVALRRGKPAWLPSRRIPGSLALSASRGSLLMVAAITLDAYAEAVALAELGPDWPAEAVAAQAIVARTYALRHPARHASDGADLCDLAHCQVFKGKLPASLEVRRALSATAGQVLESGGQPVEALYHAVCGGRRLANEEVFGGKPLPYLRGGPDSWCARTPLAVPWRSALTRDQLTRAFSADPDLDVGPVQSVTLASRTPSGAAADLVVEGEKGSRTVPAYRAWRDLGTTLGWNRVKSVRFGVVREPGGRVVFVGRGVGHGVGMCQWGARRLAERGYSAARILAAYYPGTTLAGGSPRW